jgi:hypothetical protein
MTKIQNLKLDGFVKSSIPVTPAKAGVQIHIEPLDSAKASLRARVKTGMTKTANAWFC